jgi:uncharacterized membrane protein
MKPLYEHKHDTHQPANVNELHRQKAKERGFNARLAVVVTESVGTMYCAYFFSVLAVFGLLAILGILPTLVALLVVWISQTFLQLTLLSVIMVGQGVQSNKSEIQADEAFKTTMKTYHEIEQVMNHLGAQDSELLKQTTMLIDLLKKNGVTLEQVEAELAKKV